MCPMQYFGDYVLGWGGKSGKAADKGTIVHKALEVIAKGKKANQDGLTYYDDELDYEVGDVWAIDVDNLLTTSYNYYKEATHHKWYPADLRDCLLWTHFALEDNDAKYDPRNRNIVDAEPHFDLTFDEPWAAYDYTIGCQRIQGQFSIKGTIDLITQTGEKTLEIIDWKTGQRKNWGNFSVKTYEDFMKDPQLRMYHYAAHQLYPWAEDIHLTVNWVRDGGPFSLCFEKSQLPQTVEMIRKKYEEIKAETNPYQDKGAKCTKFCHFGKTTFEGTNIVPIIEQRNGQTTRKGEIMTKCEQIKYCLDHRGIEKVTEHMTKPGHDVTYYKAPGSVEKK